MGFSSAETACTPIRELFGCKEGAANYEGLFASHTKLSERSSPFANSISDTNMHDHEMDCSEHFSS